MLDVRGTCKVCGSFVSVSVSHEEDAYTMICLDHADDGHLFEGELTMTHQITQTRRPERPVKKPQSGLRRF